ncbi:glycosyltransferase family 4 protein [Nocardioides soli]|uniref:Glycosyltransferase involved in cell wall biosynthesis n=1 Tax=Nocardioides soli TaxID=1036020 RepID=A0A7W4VV66_9ACTN|nr:glycosyltransferase family 4 protein [Nocardioides soli]MBB3042240.1 glycosyltransferase involved in cell wall biosynthesis [Nocardioides soli]
MSVGEAERPLKIAVVYSRLPFPMMRGDQVTIAHLLSFLAKRGHDVDLYTLDVDGDFTPEQRRWLEGASRQLRIYDQGPLHFGVGLLGSLFRLNPLQVGIFQNRRLERDLARAIGSGCYDVVYCYYVRSAPAIPRWFRPNHATQLGGRRTAAFLAMQLSQTLNTGRMAQNSHGLTRRLIYRIETRLMRRFEARVWRRFTKVMLIGPKDVEAVAAACEAEGQPMISNWLYGAHGTDVEVFRPALSDDVIPNRLVFSGSMVYEPNVQAVLWFYNNCWPELKRVRPDLEWLIVGRDPVSEIRALQAADGITVTGTVHDVGEYIRSAAVCVNPMLAAGGMQNKLLEYLASAKAVVASTVANEGIMAPPGVLRIADEPNDVVDAVLELLQNRVVADQLGERARSFVLEHWTWEAHFEVLERNFYDAVSGQVARSD